MVAFPQIHITKMRIAIAVGFVVVVAIISFVYIFGRRQTEVLPEVRLTMWGIDEWRNVEQLLIDYKSQRPNVTISYQQFNDERDYEKALLNAFAARKAPDLFILKNTWLPKYQHLMTPAFDNQFTYAKLQEFFPDVVAYDFTYDYQVYALPLYLDTLITIYNRRLFDQAGIVAPPKSWDEVIALIPRLRTLTADGSIERAAIAAGGSETSVHSGVDLLFALMMQNGTRMNSEDFTTATFNSSAGADSFDFYLQFARRGSPNYTWDESLPNSIESFALGQVAMIFDYRGAITRILEKNPYADPSVAPFPQQDPGNPIAYPSYLGIGVSNQTELSTWAWDFITFITTSNDAISYYLEQAKRPPALRALIGANIEDPYWSMSARQALVARSWIPGDGTGATAAFNEQIRAILQDKTDVDTALVTLQDKVNEFLVPQSF